MQRPPPERGWQVLVIGGASGSGKTSVSYRLARHFGVGISEADDIHLAVMRMTTPTEQPILHRFRTDPEVPDWPPERIVKQFIEVCEQLAPAYEAVVANHLESGIPLVLEGDYLLPAFAARSAFGGFANDGRVAGLFIHEDDEEQIVLNLLAREPSAGRQEKRARVSWLHSQWLVEQADAVGGLVVPARPWETSLERIIEALGTA
ncbi:MAG: hypothetical protein ABI577_16105 [bacterium]